MNGSRYLERFRCLSYIGDMIPTANGATYEGMSQMDATLYRDRGSINSLTALWLAYSRGIVHLSCTHGCMLRVADDDGFLIKGKRRGRLL